tara:strand:- start:2562 stop:3392 length:831 start_codon:yes stop_codon:yes gene_type:complete
VKTPGFYRDQTGTMQSTEGVAQIVYRSDNGAALGCIGANADTVSNRAKCDTAEELRARGFLTDLSCGQFDNGQIVWLQGRSAQGRAEIRPGHEIQNRLTMVDGYVGKTTLQICDFNYNVFCKNQWRAIGRATTKNGHRIRHTSRVNLRFDDVVKQIMASAERFRHNIEMLKHLDKQRADFTDLRAMLDSIAPLPAEGDKVTERTRTRVQNTRDRIAWAYEYAPAAAPGTRYGILQAVTYWCTHDRGHDRTRAKANMLGEGARIGQQAMLDLLDRRN